MAKNSTVVVPYDAEQELGKILTVANTTYDGGSGAFVDFAATTKLRRLFAIRLQARGTNVATLLRFHLVNGSGAITPLCRDVKVPATTASSSEPLWSRTLYFRGKMLPSGVFIRCQTTQNLAAGISVLPDIQVLET